MRHVHGFIKDTEPTNGEWEAAIEFLLRLGQWSIVPEKRHEWMLVRMPLLEFAMLLEVVMFELVCARLHLFELPCP